MVAVLSSKRAVAEIEVAIWKFGSRLCHLWLWGYELGMFEPHRWHAGVLQGFWLAVPEEAEQMAPQFSALRQKLETLEIVAKFESSPYDVSAGGPNCDPLSGEKWQFQFDQDGAYTHRHTQDDADDAAVE